MLLVFYATCVASGLINFVAPTPIPQNTPTLVCPQGYQWVDGQCKQITCPSTHFLHNGACYLKAEYNLPVINTQPCQSGNCQTVVSPVPSQPCAVASAPCQTVIVPSQVVQPCPVATTSCQTATAPITMPQPCPVTTSSCRTVIAPIPVSQPCPVASSPCQTVVAPMPVPQPCPVVSSPCQTVVAPIPVSQPCPVASSPCQTVVAPMPVPQPCPVVSSPCQTVVAPIPVSQPCPVASSPCQTVVAPMPVPQPCPVASSPCQTVVAPISVPQPCTSPLCPTINYPSPCQPVIQTPCPTTPAPNPPTPAPPITTTQPPPTQPTTRRPRPDPIIQCPKGTILLNGYCHLIYCGQGTYRDGKCIQTVCPDGTIWTGSKCEYPTPHNHTTVYMTNIITTKVNQTDINRGINYTNNMAIYITESPVVIHPPPSQVTPVPQTPSTPTPPKDDCCIVITPRVCIWEGDRYSCRSRKYRRCGSVCTHQYIYLRPPPPPQPLPCLDNDCGYDHEPFYPDCSRCDNRINTSCSSYCTKSICESNRCHPVDLRGYCGSYPGSIGCRPADGCIQDWCGDYY